MPVLLGFGLVGLVAGVVVASLHAPSTSWMPALGFVLVAAGVLLFVIAAERNVERAACPTLLSLSDSHADSLRVVREYPVCLWERTDTAEVKP